MPMLLGRKTTSLPVLPKRFFSTGLQIIIVTVQVRQWVNMWHSHLGDMATPKALVDVIVQKKVAGATKLKDQINKKFQLD